MTARRAVRAPVVEVIRTLGRLAIVLALGDLALIGYATWAAKGGGELDAGVVGLIGGVSTALSGVIGGLVGLLVNPGAGDPTTVSAPVDATVTVEPSA